MTKKTFLTLYINSNLPIGGCEAALIAVALPSKKIFHEKTTILQKLSEMDIFGTVLILGADICYTLASQKAGITQPWNTSVVIGLLVGFGLMLIAFAGLEWRLGELAMISTRLLRRNHVVVANYFVTLYFLPIYFQAVDNTSPIQSGVRFLPYIISFTIFMILTGGTLAKTGFATGLSIAGCVLIIVGTGLMITLNETTSTGKWIGYQIVAGAGIGVCFQIPASAVQMVLPQEDIAIGSAMIICESRPLLPSILD
jgi:MFS transporter, DHA2 family, glioxin efflux transporter